MIEMLAGLGRTMGFSFAAGHQPLRDRGDPRPGVALRLGQRCPSSTASSTTTWIIGAALVMYVIEFIADKIPWVDSVWDARPHRDPAARRRAHRGQHARRRQPRRLKTLIGLLGGTLAAGTHFTKAGTRAVANTSPEPFSNWILSFGEDVFVVSLGFVALKYPLAAALIVLVAVVLMVIFADGSSARVRRRWRRPVARRHDIRTPAKPPLRASPLPPRFIRTPESSGLDGWRSISDSASSREREPPRLERAAVGGDDPVEQLDPHRPTRRERRRERDRERARGVGVERAECRNRRRAVERMPAPDA